MDFYLNDTKGTRIYHSLAPRIDLNFDTTGFGFQYSDYTEILRPQDFPGVVSNTRYDYDNWQVSIYNSTLESIEFKASYLSGNTLNLVPSIGSLPTVEDTTRVTADLIWRPIDRLRIANAYFYTEVETKSGGSKVFSNEILRSNWNYQFTRELSLRFIAQYEETEAGPLTSLESEKNLNFDLLLRYVINPWSAFYVGYNSNQSNFEIVEMEGERELIVTNALRQDGDQFFVKISYLFQR